jgi:hypothetical protein
MAKMILGTFSFPHNPSKMTMIRPFKPNAWKKTYSDIAYFSWATMIEGLELDLEWDFMAATTFATLDGLYIADAAVVLNPQDGSGQTYNVEILTLDGIYHRGISTTAANHRKNVKMKLLIISRA